MAAIRFRTFFLALLCLLLAGCTLLPGNGVRGSILFEEYFRRGQTGFWLTEADGIGQSVIAEEVLLLEIYQPRTVQFSTLQEPVFDDFAVTVEVTQLAGSPNSSYGLLFRLQNDSAFYRFEITGNGLFVVEKRLASGEWQRMTEDWLESGAIVQGLNQTNRLAVTAEGTRLAFAINDEVVHETQDGTYAAGKIAVSAGTFNQGGLRVAFDNLVVRSP